jgi:hypothetical protein
MSRFANSRRKYAYILLKLTTPTNIATPITTTDTNALAILARLGSDGTKYNTARNISMIICATTAATITEVAVIKHLMKKERVVPENCTSRTFLAEFLLLFSPFHVSTTTTIQITGKIKNSTTSATSVTY